YVHLSAQDHEILRQTIWLGSECCEENRSRRQNRRREMCGTYQRERIGDHRVTSLRRDLGPDAKGEVALCTMGVDRKHAPDHLVGARRQRLESHPELGGVIAS